MAEAHVRGGVPGLALLDAPGHGFGRLRTPRPMASRCRTDRRGLQVTDVATLLAEAGRPGCMRSTS
jgi:hypothetical protein